MNKGRELCLGTPSRSALRREQLGHACLADVACPAVGPTKFGAEVDLTEGRCCKAYAASRCRTDAHTCGETICDLVARMIDCQYVQVSSGGASPQLNSMRFATA